MQSIVVLIGIGLCAMALVQFALWSAQGLSLISRNKKQFELSQEILKRQIQSRSKKEPVKALPDGGWNGFRWFRVAKLVKETDQCTSVYFKPEDGKEIVSFKPGQHLTFKFLIPGQTEPVVRCYSLSNAPGQDYYRISVKRVPPPRDKPELPSGRASTFVNQGLMVGDRIEVKAPSGHFFVDEASTAPVVLLGGGIGITPMVSIANHVLEQNKNRMILLVYGVRNGADQAFKAHFEQLAQKHDNFHLVNCYSHPLSEDQEGRDYQVKGFASIDLLKQILPDPKCQFYMCGPPPFMNSLYNGLIKWGVPESRIFFEAFGPASIGKTKKKAGNPAVVVKTSSIKFVDSDAKLSWNGSAESILELAEENEIQIDSGCRAGSCGSCATALLKGKVQYPDQQSVDCEPGHCLVCIAKPDGDIELEA